MLYPINPSLNKLIFLLKFCRFYNILAKIFNDLPFPCQDLQGSWQENVRSWQKNERSLKILARKWKILENHGKKMKDPPRSWQENERSLRISGRISKIFKDFPKVIMKILKRIIKGRHVTSCFVLFCVTEKFILPCWKSSVSSKFTAYFVKQLTK